MITRLILVHYHEIGLKQKNRRKFEDRLIKNIAHSLRGLGDFSVRKISGYVVVCPKAGADSESETDLAAAFELVRKVPGVARVSMARRTGLDEQEYCAAAIRALGESGDFASFKVQSRRSSTDYPLHSMDLNRLVGSALCEAFPDKRVDVHRPDRTVFVHVVQGWVFVYAHSLSGVGGLPVGTAGKVVSLLSSGIDSPVASWMVGRRGAVVVAVHFSGRPMVSDASEWLVRDIVEALGPAGSIGRLYVVPFGEAQRTISLAVPQKLRIIMYRRLMVRLASRIAALEGAKALVTGESLGQVASQTLENIAAVDELADIPVFRPLIGSDKQEIIRRAQEIGTFEISSRTQTDCCTLFMPKSPETHAHMTEVHAAWESFDHEALADELMGKLEWMDLRSCPAYAPPKNAMREYHETLQGRELP